MADEGIVKEEGEASRRGGCERGDIRSVVKRWGGAEGLAAVGGLQSVQSVGVGAVGAPLE